ncbi:hypothetical protein D9757_005078 [Collybiopsis confluens]|uniref:Uncharacterized protein n=1 Tax=Collybiopsis confluens TaxID=2823264 RepID=A0A8H5HSV2_9AGAR|nr:hypothetical protein D9757_005078 [Collybiopsis confluens]
MFFRTVEHAPRLYSGLLCPSRMCLGQLKNGLIEVTHGQRLVRPFVLGRARVLFTSLKSRKVSWFRLAEMSTLCTSTPTATSTHLITSSTVSTSFSEQVTTIPGTTSLILATSCASFSTPTGSSASAAPVCVSSETVTIGTTTIGGGAITTSVPVLTTITAVSTDFTTLFGSICTTVRGDSNTTAASPPTVSVTTPPPALITSQSSSTLPNGDVTVVSVTRTLIVPPSSFTVTSTDAAPASNNPSSSHSASNHLGAIIGGTVGGIFALVALLISIRCFITRRRKRWDDIFEHDIPAVMAQRSDRGDFSLADEMEPKPYEFGVVGAASNSHSPYSIDSQHSSNQGYRNSSILPTHLLSSPPGVANRPASPEGKERALASPASPIEAAGRDDYFDYQHLNFYSSVEGGGGQRKLQIVNGDARRTSLVTLNQGLHLDLSLPERTIVEDEKGGTGGSNSSHGKSTALPSATSPTHFFRDATSIRPLSSHRGS